mgnify:CR=1 FL=1
MILVCIPVINVKKNMQSRIQFYFTPFFYSNRHPPFFEFWIHASSEKNRDLKDLRVDSPLWQFILNSDWYIHNCFVSNISDSIWDQLFNISSVPGIPYVLFVGTRSSPFTYFRFSSMQFALNFHLSLIIPISNTSIFSMSDTRENKKMFI